MPKVRFRYGGSIIANVNADPANDEEWAEKIGEKFQELMAEDGTDMLQFLDLVDHEIIPDFPCQECRGKGRLPNPGDILGTETCPACGGTGRTE